MRARLLLPALLVLLLAATGRGDPRDSLTGADMLPELAARRAATASVLGPGTLVLFATPAKGLFPSRPEPNLFWLSGIDEPPAALVLGFEFPEATKRALRIFSVSDRIRRAEDALRDCLSRTAALARRDSELRKIAREAWDAVRLARTDRLRAEWTARSELGTPRVHATLYLPAPSPQRAKWEGPGLSADGDAPGITGIDDVRDIRKLFGDLRTSLPEGARLFRIPRRDLAPDQQAGLDALVAARPDLAVLDPSPAFAVVRAVKSAEEVARIRRACEITAAGLRECMRSCRPGLVERDLQAVLEYVCHRGGAVRQAFPSIVGAGRNGVILHYKKNSAPLTAGDLVLMDVGAEYLGYAADVTRTFPVGGRFSKEQAKIYDIVLKAQAAGIAAVRPGATFRDVDRAARKVIEDAGYGKAFTHATSHYVGLDVHDPGPGGPLVPGMVLTVEPGIYLAPDGPGIRIEDTVLVTKDGADVLSAAAPKERAAIEKLMREKGVGDGKIR